MLKLMKYEFRKNRLGLLVMVLIAAGIFALAPLGRLLEKEELLFTSVILLFFYALAAYIYVLIQGITAYSGELRGKTGYLLMLVPRSTMSILFGKLLFTFAFALVMLAICVIAFCASGVVLLGDVYEVKSLFEMVRMILLQGGYDIAAIAYMALYIAAGILTSVLTVVAMGYLAVTMSSTLLSNGKLRGLLSFLFFCGLLALMSYLQNLVTPEISLYGSYAEALRSALPGMLMDLALTCVFTALSAVMLKRWVSL